MAKRFQFRLETLLRVREIREREAKRKVGAQRAQIARVDQLNQQTAEEIAHRQSTLREHQQRGRLAPDALIGQRAWIAYLRWTIVQRHGLRAGLVEELETLRDELRRARREKRIIEKLRARRWEEYVKQRRRREQAESDELARQLLVFDRASGATAAGCQRE